MPNTPYITAPLAEPSLTVPPRLGAHLVGDGVDIAIEAPHASAVWACFMDPADPTSEWQVALRPGMHGVWSGHVSSISAGQFYGVRADGRWDPAAGHVYNPAKLLLDPYARAVGRARVWIRRCMGMRLTTPQLRLNKARWILGTLRHWA